MADSSAAVSKNQGPVSAIFLVGFMGAGKTSVGHALAQRLGWRFVDLDDRIVQRTGCTVADLFTHRGEAEFRRLETTELEELLRELPRIPAVVALGGGSWVQESNSALLRAAELPVIFLDAPVEELWQRCLPEGAVRPLLRNEGDFRKLYEARRPRYLEGTTAVNTSGENIPAVAERILLLLRLAHSPVST